MRLENKKYENLTLYGLKSVLKESSITLESNFFNANLAWLNGSGALIEV